MIVVNAVIESTADNIANMAGAIAAMEAASVLGEDSIPLSEDAGCLVARLAMPAVAVAVIDFQV